MEKRAAAASMANAMPVASPIDRAMSVQMSHNDNIGSPGYASSARKSWPLSRIQASDSKRCMLHSGLQLGRAVAKSLFPHP
jgi:hypothetical protein